MAATLLPSPVSRLLTVVNMQCGHNSRLGLVAFNIFNIFNTFHNVFSVWFLSFRLAVLPTRDGVSLTTSDLRLRTP
jgi:hypothetical protein